MNLKDKLKQYHETTSEIINEKEYLVTKWCEPLPLTQPKKKDVTIPITVQELRRELGLK
jgi:hypothetical protein